VSERMEYKLKSPIAWGNETIEVLAFREVEAGDLFDIPTDRAPSMKEMVTLAAKLCGQDLVVMKKLKGRDLKDVMDILGKQLDASL